MSCLAEWQSAVAAAIDSEAATCPCPDRAVEVPGPSIEQGFAVYRNSSRGARARALEDAYPVCRRLLGGACFGALAARFIGECASRGSDLNRFGEGFSVSLGATVEHQPAFDRYPWLGDLVRLEWLCHSIYYRDDDAPFDLGLLERADPDALVVWPTHRVAWMHSRWPVHEIWAAHLGGQEPPAMRVEPGDWFLVVEREAFRARVSAVDAALWQMLRACQIRPSIADLANRPTLDLGRLGELVQRRWVGVSAQADHAV